MKMFTITYDRSGRIATATVQGNEITTMDDLLCIRKDGVPLATFPKQDVLHVTSNSPGDDRPAPVEELGMPVRGPLDPRAAQREDYWTRLRTALDPTPVHETGARGARRSPAAGEVRRRRVGGGVAAAGSGGSVRSTGARAR